MSSIPGKSSRLYVFAGVPVNGTSGTFAGIAPKGSVLIDSTNAGAYQNTNTLASPTWSAFPASSGTLATLLAAIPATAVADVAAANSVAAAGANPTKAEYDVAVAEANETKLKLNTVLARLRTVGILAP